MIKSLNKVIQFLMFSQFILFSSCSSILLRARNASSPSPIKLVDKNATPETQALANNLKQLSKNHTLFGHQHATEYGHGWAGDNDQSDVKAVTGSHPAVIGVDIGGFTVGSPAAMEKAKTSVRKNIIDTYNRGGVSTIAWHFSNPMSGGGFYWKDSISIAAVQHMRPGGKAHDTYKNILRSVGEWANNTKGSDGKLVPMLFRPYHEFDGDWFWWGKAHTSREDFIALWRFTVSYLRDSMNVHNFIYGFSPDNTFHTEGEFLERYPGDEWVDLVGMDNYGDMGRYGIYKVDSAIHKLKIVSDYARRRNKLAAFTETGLESIPNPAWWNDVLLKVMKTPGMELCYVLVWRNDQTSATHYYAPFPGHSSVPGFLKYYNDPYTLFEKNLPPMYKVNTGSRSLNNAIRK